MSLIKEATVKAAPWPDELWCEQEINIVALSPRDPRSGLLQQLALIILIYHVFVF